LTIRPRPRRISGRKACTIATGPNRLTSSCLRKSAIGWSSIGAGTPMPALLTRPDRPRLPTAFFTVATASTIDEAFVTSMISGVIGADACACSASPSFARRTPAKTRNPCSARCNAVAAPIPVDVPVMRT
jgi:hypothetical protein